MRTIYEFDVNGKTIRFEDINKAREFEQELKQKELLEHTKQKHKQELVQKMKAATEEVNKLMDQYEKETGEVAQVFQNSKRRIYIETYNANSINGVLFGKMTGR